MKGTEDPSEWKFYAGAGLGTISVLMWTVAVMRPTNNELMRLVKVAKEAGKTAAFERDSVVALARWSWMNYVRGILPLVGAWVGLYAALK